MKNFYFIGIAFFFVVLLASCSPQIVGTWNVEKYSTITKGEDGPSMSNIGTMTFQRNGRGVNDMSFNILGEGRKDSEKFTWKEGENHIRITNDDSDLERIWIFVESKRRSQKWMYVDRDNQIHVLELGK